MFKLTQSLCRILTTQACVNITQVLVSGKSFTQVLCWVHTIFVLVSHKCCVIVTTSLFSGESRISLCGGGCLLVPFSSVSLSFHTLLLPLPSIPSLPLLAPNTFTSFELHSIPQYQGAVQRQQSGFMISVCNWHLRKAQKHRCSGNTMAKCYMNKPKTSKV